MTTASPRRICFLLIGLEGYGIRRVWQGMMRGMSARGHKITIVMLQPEYLSAWKDFIPTGVEVISPPPAKLTGIRGKGLGKFISLARRGLSQMRIARWLARELTARGIDRIVVRSPLEVFLAGIAARSSGATAFWMMPNSVSSDYPLDINRRIYRALFNRGHVVPVANSHYTDSTLGSGSFRRHVVHLGIHPDLFDPAAGLAEGQALRERLGIPQGAPVLGVFARVTQEKGQGVIIEALAKVDPSLHLVICGGPLDTPFAQGLRTRVVELGLEGRVHFEGPQSDIVPYYALCDVLLNTRLDPEPFGMSVIEAMAVGKPILAHRAGGPGETILDGQTGWLMDSPTVEAFTHGLERMLADRDRWPEIGTAARAHVLAHFTESRMVSDIEGLISAPTGTAVPA